MKETFEAARDSAYTQDWNVLAMDMHPDLELENCETLTKLRIRARQLIKDNLIAAGAQLAYTNAVGTPVKIDITSENRIQQKQASDLIKEHFKACDITKTESLDTIVEQIVSWAFADGDILINLPMDPKRSTPLKTVIELIDASRIRTPVDMRKDPNVRLGVKYDKEGRILGYYVKKQDRLDRYGDRSIDYDFYPMYREADGLKRRVTYLFKAPLNPRPKVSRQYPVITPCITRFKLLKDYEEAVVVGARVAACFSAFILTNNPVGAQKSMLDSDSKSGTKRSNENKTLKLKPGMVTYLKKDAQEIKFAQPNVPGDNVDKFRVREYKLISMYLRIPYEILFLDLSETNYSSWKGGILETKKMIGRWRRQLNEILDWFAYTLLAEAVSKGLVRGDVANLKIRKRWPSFGLLDPEKESRSNRLRIQNKTASPQLICDEEGNDYEDIQADLDEDALREQERQAKLLANRKKLEEKYGILFPETEEARNAAAEAKPGGTKPEKEDRDTSKSRREGEKKGKDLDPEDARERRKQDGNW